MKTISRLFNTWTKRVAIAAVAVVAGLVLPAITSASAAVQLESSLGVANVTAGDTDYKPSVSASYDQIVKLQVYYHNTELPNSGKIAENVKVKINVPTTPGKNQTVSSTVSGDNTNTVTSNATINLDRSDAYLQYIPGSAVWKHNIGGRPTADQNFVEQIVSDNVVLGGNGLVLENQKPCYEYAGTVTVLVRVMVPGVTITKEVQKATESGKWAAYNTAAPSDKLKYLITYKNTGNTVQKQVIIRDNLPAHMTLVPGTTVLTNSANPNGTTKLDTVAQGGINIGNANPGAVSYLVFQVQLDGATSFQCGNTELRNVGVVKPEGMFEYYNTAITTVQKECVNTPSYSCDLVTIKKTSGRTVEVKVTYTAKNGATFKSVTYNFGDGSATLTTDKTTVTHTYATDGTYKVTANLLIAVNGVNQNVTGAGCTQSVSFTPELPHTGAGSVIATVLGASVLGAVVSRLFISRRLTR